ncbi:hypothetical protein CR513_01148, partial [Mucuna pruriens]
MTRSRRIFAPKALRNKEPTPVKKEKTIESPKRTVTEEEAREFLKVIRLREYEMLDQFHKIPTQISLLSLLINSESHRELLLKILNEAHVPQDITPAKFGGIINNITASCHLSFSEEEVLDEGKNHNQPLHIAVNKGADRQWVLTQRHAENHTGQTLLPGPILRNSPVVVRDFDGSKREVMGEITLTIRIGPTTFDITFQVQLPSSNEIGRGDIKQSKAVIMAAKVLITNGFELGKGLGRRLDGIANLVAIQENPRRAGLGFSRVARKAKSGWKVQSKQQVRTSLYRCFISGGIVTLEHVATVEDQPMEPVEIIISPNKENFPQINNAALAPNDADKPVGKTKRKRRRKKL